MPLCDVFVFDSGATESIHHVVLLLFESGWNCYAHTSNWTLCFLRLGQNTFFISFVVCHSILDTFPVDAIDFF